MLMLSRMASLRASGGIAGPSAFDPASATTFAVLSEGNTALTSSGGAAQARGTASHVINTGRWYFQFRLSNVSNFSISGISDSALVTTSGLINPGSTGFQYQAFIDGVSGSFIGGAPAENDIIGILYDSDLAGSPAQPGLGFSINGVWYNASGSTMGTSDSFAVGWNPVTSTTYFPWAYANSAITRLNTAPTVVPSPALAWG